MNLGFTGSDCSININECLAITCPQNSTCQDGVNSAKCVCLDDKVGENCEKGNFDFFCFCNLSLKTAEVFKVSEISKQLA